MPNSTSYTAKIPDESGQIPYTDAENAVWADLVARQQPNVDRFSAPEYLAGQRKLDLQHTRIPQ